MKKVLIATPSYDGKVDVWYTNSLINTIKIASHFDCVVFPVFMAYDALVQRARNDLVSLAIEEDFDEIIFIDADIEWHPEWVFKLLSYDVDVVGAPVVKKSDYAAFNIKALSENMEIEENGLAEIECIGTGFLRVSRNALEKVWKTSKKYKNEGRECRMVFDVQIVNGDLVSEDNVFCQKWRKLGGKVYADVNMTCNHIGTKKYGGSFAAYLKFLQDQEKETVQ